ncbi:S8 family serine peptidase [Flexithrix dorotheae]|uniref:S8 family serine peptidase n=1 Tax=Flexithrix dorotheae TaxID=70993 RepID=UPI0003666F04|nr:S8 family serine peptidase [Flexithrix dorotheae]
MKNLYYILVFAFSPIFSYAQENEKTFIRKDEIIVKVDASFFEKNQEAQLLSGSYQLDEYLNKPGIKSYQQIFPANKKREAKLKSLGNSGDISLNNSAEKRSAIGNFYQIKVAEGSDINGLLKDLNNENWVEYAEPSFYNELLFVPNDTTYLELHWGHEHTGVYEAWDISQGDTNIVIGIVDTGVKTTHQSLRDQLYFNDLERYGIGGVDDDGNGFIDDSLGYDFGDFDTDVSDVFGHGTEVAGVASAKVNDSFGTFGVGYNCRFMPVKIANSAGYLINAYQAAFYAAENGCDIINLSWGRPTGGPSKFEEEVMNYIVEVLDVAIVAAAGNTSNQLDFYPASYRNVLSVIHSLDTSNVRVSPGTYSYYIDVMAPGAYMPTTSISSGMEGHKIVSGSSYASPFVAGALGLIRSEFPDLSAKQCVDLIKATTDDVIYDVPGNSAFTDRLGKGLLNVYRALTEKNDHKSIFVENITTEGFVGNAIIREDTMNIWAQYKSILEPTTSNCKVTLSSPSEFVEIISDEFSIGALTTGDSIDNENSPFQVLFKNDLPANKQIFFKLSLEDSLYQDYQYFELNTDDLFNARLGDFRLTIGQNGQLGWKVEDSVRTGLGIRWKNQKLIEEAGLVLVVDSVNSLANFNGEIGNFQNDFETKFELIYAADSLEYKGIEGVFYDEDTVLGLEIKQNFKSWGTGDSLNFLALSYTLENNSSELIDSLHVGLFINWGEPDSKQTANWDSVFNFGIIEDLDNNYFVGVKILDESFGYYAFNLPGEIDEINLEDGFSTSEQINSLNQEIQNPEAGGISGGDVANITGLNNIRLNPGDERKLTYILLAGESIEELRQGFVFAAQKLDFEGLKGEIPEIQDTSFCFNEIPSFFPEGGDYFKFYADESLSNEIGEGDSILLGSGYSGNKIFITNADKILESDPLEVSFIINDSIPGDFEVVSSIDYNETAFLSPIPDFGSGVQKFSWNFGDSENLIFDEFPNYKYEKNGAFTITLTLEDSLGCEKLVQKQIQVSGVEGRPVLKDTILCEGANMVISLPDSSDFWVFSDNSFQDTLFQGKSLTIPAIEQDTILLYKDISAPDSTYISHTININQIFVALKIPSLVIEKDVYEYGLGNLPNHYQSISWDFGDGTEVSDDTLVNHQYDSAGIYLISVNFVDSLGCSTFLESEIIVYGNAGLPKIDQFQNVCPGDSIKLMPSGGENFRFYFNESLDSLGFEGGAFSFIPKSNVTKVFITNIDSVEETLPRAVTVFRPDYSTVLDIIPDSLEIAEDLTLYLRGPNGSDWNWEFGNGDTSNVQNPVLVIAESGELSISLEFTDSLDCRHQITREVMVFAEDEPVTTGLERPENEDIIVFPNPSIGKVNFLFPTYIKGKASIHLFNLEGKILLEKQIESFNKSNQFMDLESLESGLYMLHISTNEIQFRQKVRLIK